MTLSPLSKRRLDQFKANRRGYWSLWIFLVIFTITTFAELIANEKPILVKYKGEYYTPVFKDYPETTFGGTFETEANFRDPIVRQLINKDGWMIWPLIPFSYHTINYDLTVPAPSSPSFENLLGTDDQGRDLLARLIYGYRISIIFGLLLAGISCLIGLTTGAIQGYFGGNVDLMLQRVIEIWGGLPILYLLIIISSMVTPNFWWLLAIMSLFSWIVLVLGQPKHLAYQILGLLSDIYYQMP
jgi:microcin C transport system permease protein